MFDPLSTDELWGCLCTIGFREDYSVENMGVFWNSW